VFRLNNLKLRIFTQPKVLQSKEVLVLFSALLKKGRLNISAIRFPI